MANHIRQQIRERVGTTLTGLTTTGSNVFQSRVYNLQDAKLPAIIIYTRSADSELLEMGSTRTLQRNLSLVVEAYVKANSNYDDTIDTIAKEVEAAMGADEVARYKSILDAEIAKKVSPTSVTKTLG